MKNNTYLHAFKTNDSNDKIKEKTIETTKEVMDFIIMNNDDKKIFLDGLTQDKKDLFLQTLIETLGDNINNLINTTDNINELIKDQKEKINELKCKELLPKIKSFDPSDIRLIRECDLDSKDAIIDAEWCVDHIEIFTRKWGWRFPMAKTLEYIEYVLNHEYLHHIIYEIMTEDGIYYNEYDGHWAYYAGEIDLLHGISASKLHREFFESNDSIKTTMEILSRCSKAPLIDATNWTWL